MNARENSFSSPRDEHSILSKSPKLVFTNWFEPLQALSSQTTNQFKQSNQIQFEVLRKRTQDQVIGKMVQNKKEFHVGMAFEITDSFAQTIRPKIPETPIIWAKRQIPLIISSYQASAVDTKRLGLMPIPPLAPKIMFKNISSRLTN